MRKCSAIGAAVGVLAAIVPASSEDAGIYSFIHSEARGRSYSPPVRVAPQIAPRSPELAPRQRLTRPAVARVPDRALAEEPSPKINRDPKTIGEVSNPLPALLADETLRPGDMVVFPDGVRVFRGKPGSRHQLADFVKPTETKRLAASDRKLLARIVVGQNSAWSFDAVQPSKVAEKRRDTTRPARHGEVGGDDNRHRSDEPLASMTLRSVRHIAVGVRRSYAEVYAFLSQPENFPKWASGLGHSFQHRAGFEWVAETPFGIMAIRFSEPNEFGVLDHWLVPESGAPMHNPMRAFPAGDGTEVVFSLVQRPELSDEEFARDAEWVAKDLAALKALLEIT